MTILATLRVIYTRHHIGRFQRTICSSAVACKNIDINYLLSKMSTEPPAPKPNMQKKWERRQPEKLRHIKYRENVKNLPVPGIMNFQVIGTGGRGGPRSILLVTEHYRYLFNCGEGTQRIVSENRMKPSRIEHIFITHHSWNNVGGLLGMALTLQSVGMPKVTLHGPPDIEDLVNHSKRFADTKATNLVKYNASNGSFQDHTMKVEYVPLYRNEAGEEPDEKRQKVSEEAPGVRLCNDMAVGFLCQPELYPRKMMMEKCVDLGITKGPQIGELKKGNEITLPSGKVIKPDDVLSDQLPSQPFLIIECPTVDYLDSLETSEKLNLYQNDGTNMDEALDVVVHLTPHDVLEQPRYQAWIKRFPANTNHLILDESSSNLVSLGILRIQAVLNMLSDRVFPLLVGQRNGPVSQKPSQDALNGPVVSGCTNLIYHYRPRKGFDTEHCLEIDNDVFIKEALEQDNVEELLSEMREKLAALENRESKSSHPYPEIVFLGTGSSVPSKVRNVSGILLHLTEDSCILLDCGEGTLGQLYRYYGDKTAEVLQKLKCIYVSHMHADHHLGLFNILFERDRVVENKEKLLLLAPQGYGSWMKNFQDSFYPVNKYVRLFPLQDVNEYETDDEDYNTILQHLHLKEIKTTFVHHVPGSFGVAITHQDGWKITYSGDTTPCDNLVKIGANSDILIHEASMEDDLEEEARFKTHSTTSQAIEIGLRMNARFTLLNHFSQRYAKVPVFSDKFSDKVGFSFDNMRVTMDDIPLFPHFIEPLKAMFAEHYAEMEIKTIKKNAQARFQGQVTGKKEDAQASSS